MTAYIYQNGGCYDRLFASNGDLQFWLEQAGRYGDPILELASGTGRVAIALAAAGYTVTGLDNAEGMLAEARRKSGAVKWVQADMRDFDLGERFALIILPANTLCHLLSPSDLGSCLRSVKRHLAPGGKFVLDVSIPRPELLINYPGRRFRLSEYDHPEGGGRVVVTYSYNYASDTQIKRIRFYQALPDAEREIRDELSMRMYFPRELDALLECNGFHIDAKFGGYDRRVFDGTAETQLVVCSTAVDNVASDRSRSG